MINYKAIFDGVEASLFARSTLSLEMLRQQLDRYKHFEGRQHSDEDFYWILVYVVFFSGFRAATVNNKLEVIRGHFPGYRQVAQYGEPQVQGILTDEQMIRNERKIRSCITNAKRVAELVGEYGSVQNYLDSYQNAAPESAFESMMLLKEDLACRFSGLGDVTAFHILTDVGMQVVKPDLVVCRTFHRLGLIPSTEHILRTVHEANRFVAETGFPARYIDIVFAAFGQVRSEEFGLASGICLDVPDCGACRVQTHCRWYAVNRLNRG